MTDRKLLTQEEVAERLRCSTEKVKRLRLKGELAYYPGRPVLIAEDDLEAYLESIRRKVAAKRGPEPGSPEERQARLQASSDLARKIWMQRHLRAKAGIKS